MTLVRFCALFFSRHIDSSVTSLFALMFAYGALCDTVTMFIAASDPIQVT